MSRRRVSLAPFALALLALLAPLVAIRADDAAIVDALPAKSRWAGTEGADETHAHSRSIAVHLTVTKRDGTKFVAEFWLARDSGVRVKGNVTADGQVDCVPTEILKGKWGRNILAAHWHGTASKDQLVLTRPLQDGGERTATLALAAAADDGDAPKHAKK